MRLYAVCTLVLLSAFACAQTRWEYALFTAETSINPLDESGYFYQDSEHFIIGSIEDILIEIGGSGSDPLDVLQVLGQQGYELATHEKVYVPYDKDLRYFAETWYFKRPLP